MPRKRRISDEPPAPKANVCPVCLERRATVKGIVKAHTRESWQWNGKRYAGRHWPCRGAGKPAILRTSIAGHVAKARGIGTTLDCSECGLPRAECVCAS